MSRRDVFLILNFFFLILILTKKNVSFGLSLQKCYSFFHHEPIIYSIILVFEVTVLKTKKKCYAGTLKTGYAGTFTMITLALTEQMFAFWLPKDHVFPWYWHLGLCICSWFDNLWFLQANIKNCRAGTIFYTDFNHRKCITYALSLLKCCLFFDHEPLICSIHSDFKVIMFKTIKKCYAGTLQNCYARTFKMLILALNE